MAYIVEVIKSPRLCGYVYPYSRTREPWLSASDIQWLNLAEILQMAHDH